VHYYGPYSNASHQRPVTTVASRAPDCPDDPDNADQGEYTKERRARWARLIRMVWLEDPLLCSRCGGAMRIISFITDRPVIDRILRHIGFKHAASISSAAPVLPGTTRVNARIELMSRYLISGLRIHSPE